MAAFLCRFYGPLETSVAVYQLFASCWLTFLDRVSTQLGRKDKECPSAWYLLGFLSLSLYGPSNLPPSSTPDTGNEISASSNLISTYISPAIICLYSPDMLQHKRSKWRVIYRKVFPAPVDPRLTAGCLAWLAAWLPGWLCCSPRSCLPHWRVRRLILTKFSPTWNLMSRVQKPRKVIFRTYKKTYGTTWDEALPH